VFNQKTIPIQEGLTLIAQRIGQSVQVGGVLHEHKDYLDAKLFDQANFSNKIYANSAGGVLNAAIRRANPVLGLNRCLKPMVLAGTAADTRPDSVFYLTVDTAIWKGTKSASITQSFALPQGIWDTTRPNGFVYTTHGYMEDDPMTMSPG